MFLIWKPVIFRKVQLIKYLSGGVVLYAAQTNAQIDAEIAKKGGFRTETNYDFLYMVTTAAPPRPRLCCKATLAPST